MTCGPTATTFRILDRHAAWTEDLSSLGEATIGDAIELAPRNPPSADPGTIARAIPPPWIARGEPCEWFLVCPPRQLLRYGPRPAAPCAAPRAAGVPIAGPGCHLELIEPVAVAAARRRLAVLDRGRRELVILTPEGDRIVAAIPTLARGPIAFGGGEILVADGEALAAYNLVTLEPHELPRAPGAIARLAVVGGATWIAVERDGGALELFHLAGGAWTRGEAGEPRAAAGGDTGLAWADATKACLELPRRDEPPRTAWIDRCGREAEPPPAPLPSTARREGRVVSALRSGGPSRPIDSGIPRCIWHRVRVDLELPRRTGAELRLATTESPDATAEAIAEGDWQVIDLAKAMPSGTTTTATTTAATSDFLIEQPPGRYLFLDLRLRSDGDATPRIRRLRIDFPRSTSATRLPGVFREDPFAAGFLERFVALFDASIEDLDRVIDRFPALLDPRFAPPEVLSWLGGFLDVALDPAWPEQMRRDLLAEAPELYRRRGTPWALSRAIELVAGIRPKILETHGTNPFSRLAGARAGNARGFRLGDARLFGRARARFWLGASSLGDAPLRSYGDPDRDHVAELGWRVTVQVPSGAHPTPTALSRMRRIIESQKPAHVAVAVRTEAALLRLGVDSSVGIDTYLGRSPPAHLGTSTWLRRTVLAYGRSRGAGVTLGTASAIGIHTVLS